MTTPMREIQMEKQMEFEMEPGDLFGYIGVRDSRNRYLIEQVHGELNESGG